MLIYIEFEEMLKTNSKMGGNSYFHSAFKYKRHIQKIKLLSFFKIKNISFSMHFVTRGLAFF